MASKNLESDFFNEDTTHGYIKRLMYKKYLQAYIAKTQSVNRYRTVIIDGFAGAGRYGNKWPDAIESYGSPLIAVMVALRFLSRTLGEENIVFGPPPSVTGSEPELEMEMNALEINTSDIRPDDIVLKDFAISLFFIEDSIDNYTKLKWNVKQLLIYFMGRYFPDTTYSEHQISDGNGVLHRITAVGIQIAIFQRKFKDFVPPSGLSEGNIRSLTFLDPFGYSYTPMQHVARFASGRGKELFINFMSSYVNRFVSRSKYAVVDLYGITVQSYAREQFLAHHEEENMSQDDITVEFVKHVIFFNSDPIHGRRVNNVQKCAENYEQFLKTKTGSEFALSFEVRGKKNAIIYHMIHITNHRKGLEAMKEAMNRCSQTEGQMTMSDFNILKKGHELNLGNCDDQNKVADVIFNNFAGRENVPIGIVSNFVWLDTPYVYRKKPLKFLQKNGRITKVQDNDGQSQKRKHTFPDHTKWLISFAG